MAMAGMIVQGSRLLASGLSRALPRFTQPSCSATMGRNYQPSNTRRWNVHSYETRLKTRGGIEVLLRRMLKGRHNLAHFHHRNKVSPKSNYVNYQKIMRYQLTKGKPLDTVYKRE
ncbi:39S ribosomal protein L34, mitochondrial [Branchiostoma belcheri]|nr:39S ribosomal protein L34, mitochondrial [Branchiostoma belcheri]